MPASALTFATHSAMRPSVFSIATVEELNALKETYDPKAIYEANPVIRRALDTLCDGTFEDRTGFEPGYHSLLERMRRAYGKKVVHLTYAFGDFWWSYHIADPPACDRVGLGKR